MATSVFAVAYVAPQREAVRMELGGPSMSALISAMAESWSSVSLKSKASSNSRWWGHVGVGREGCALGGLALGGELEELGGHIGHGFFDAGLGLLPVLACLIC